MQLKALNLDFNKENQLQNIKGVNLQGINAVFNDLKIEKPGNFLLMSCLSNFLHVSCFISTQILNIASPVSSLKISVPSLISTVTKSVIEVSVYMKNNQLFTRDPLEIILNVTDSTTTSYTSTTSNGVAKFYLSLLIATKYEFQAYLQVFNISSILKFL